MSQPATNTSVHSITDGHLATRPCNVRPVDVLNICLEWVTPDGEDRRLVPGSHPSFSPSLFPPLFISSCISPADVVCCYAQDKFPIAGMQSMTTPLQVRFVLCPRTHVLFHVLGQKINAPLVHIPLALIDLANLIVHPWASSSVKGARKAP